MKSYWSCSEFADWIRGTPKLKAGTSKEWNEWRTAAKKKKFRYWVAEEGLDYIENFIYWPRNRLNDIRHYIDNRWISKTHALTSNLTRGQWHEFDTCMLHSAFDSLVDFVEIEQAWFHIICCDEANKKYGTPWYRSIFRIRKWRSAESGLDYLNWAANLRHDEAWIEKSDPDFGKPTNQALVASETITLYKWWKEERPKRADPMDASGLSDYYDERHQKAQERGDDFLFDFEDKTDDDKASSQQMHEICNKMECEQEEEDTEMLIRLVKLSKKLWT